MNWTGYMKEAREAHKARIAANKPIVDAIKTSEDTRARSNHDWACEPHHWANVIRRQQMNHNQHVKTYLRLMQDRLNDIFLEDTERMTDAGYSGWRIRYDEAKVTSQMLRETLQRDGEAW